MTRLRIQGGWAAIVFAGMFISLPAATADDGWLHEFDEATAAAKQQEKDILIDFSGTDWCRPCQRLWSDTLNQAEFIQQASSRFVLLDIDNLARLPMPEGRKERYDALQERYGIHAFPTVVLATAEGLPYASTGLLEDSNNPVAYWQHLEPLYERGQKFKAAIKAAGGTKGLNTAQTIVAALSELRPDFVVKFYAGALKRLRELTPTDETGYLAFIDVQTALLRLETKLHGGFTATYDKWSDGKETGSRWMKEFSPEDVNAIIKEHQPRGPSLREALVARLFLEIDARDWTQALNTLEEVAAIDEPLSPFEKANFVQFLVRSRETLLAHIQAARRHVGKDLDQLRLVYGILKNDLECKTPTSCCNHSFTLQMHQLLAGEAYGQLLLDSTANLQGEDRAAAIGRGLDGIELYANGSIGRIVCELMPELVGKEKAMQYLPPRYADWLRD